MVISPQQLRSRLEELPDPELPWVTLADLGILREIRLENNRATVEVTPTWSGCPAMDAIRESIHSVLEQAGFGPQQIEITTTLSPAWTTDDITAAGRLKLNRAGIAPPRTPAEDPSGSFCCPRCQFSEVGHLSEFGPTACKALMVCRNCHEPFERFKEL